MNKSKLFIGAGALVLAISSFTNSKDKKFAGTKSAYFQTSGGVWNTLFKASANDAPRLTTIKASSANKTTFFRTSGGNNYRLYKGKTSVNGNTIFTK